MIVYVAQSTRALAHPPCASQGTTVTNMFWMLQRYFAFFTFITLSVFSSCSLVKFSLMSVGKIGAHIFSIRSISFRSSYRYLYSVVHVFFLLFFVVLSVSIYVCFHLCECIEIIIICTLLCIAHTFSDQQLLHSGIHPYYSNKTDPMTVKRLEVRVKSSKKSRLF